jgi:hypothetical protein
MVCNLHKEYDDKKDFLHSRKTTKVATKYISFCVKKGWYLFFLRKFSRRVISVFSLTLIYNFSHICRRDLGTVGSKWSWQKHSH